MEMTQKSETKIGYRDVLHQSEYRKLIIANVVSRFGDSIDCIAFTWLVYDVTGSAAWTAVIFTMNQLPSVILPPFAGALVERMNKKKIMIITDMIRGLVVVILAFLCMKDAVTPAVLIGFTLIISSVEAFRVPASVAMIPKLIEKKYYTFGSSMNSTASNIAQLIGMGLAGVIIGTWGIGAAILMDGATFFFSAGMTVIMKVREELPEKREWSIQNYVKELKGGFHYIRGKRAVFNFCLLGVLINALIVPLSSLQTPMAVELFGLGSEILSVFGVALVLGMSLGSLFLPYLMKKIKVLTIVVTAGILIGVNYGGLILGKYTYGQLIPSCLLCGGLTLLLGIMTSWVSGVLNIQFMKSVEEEYLARAASIFNASASAATPIASLIVSGMTFRLSVGTIFLMAAAGYVVIFAVAGVRRLELE